ncbi:MAG: carbohydrate binding family 9 domain-containing protein [Gemmatimonadaceae bacterium]
MIRPLGALLLLAAGLVPHALAAQQGAASSIGSVNAERRREMVAAPAARAPRIDGVLDDDVWRDAEPSSDFVQSEPQEGEPASERTVVQVAYDDDALYVAAYLHDASPDALIVNDIRKDFREDDQDSFEVLLDTFGDRRNGYVFITNPEGARSDRQVANEGREINTSWDAMWEVRTRRVADGWTVEMAIPFRAIRFDPSAGDSWGINFSRRIRRRNEIDFWSPVPRAYTLARVSLAGDLVGLNGATGGRDLRIKPYVAASTVRETGGIDYSQKADVGADLKYGVTPGLTLDVTANPDFAQAEADEQQVNLTQFSQFFPEKREFFLENSGIFYVGDAARNNRTTLAPTADEDLLLFFSRRIGLDASGHEIPIVGGARLTGRAAGMTIGLLDIQTGDARGVPATNYSVLRLRRNLFEGSDVGVIAMNKQSTRSGGDYNRVLGVDANFRFLGSIDWNSYVLGTDTPGIESGQYAWRSTLNREGNFLHVKGGAMQLGEGFNDEMGYYRRTGVRKWMADIGVRPRPARLQRLGIREIHPHLVWNYYEDLGGHMVGKNLHTGNTFFLNNGGYVEFSVNPRFERIQAPFRINRDIDPIPAGQYGWAEWQVKGQTDASRLVSASFTGIAGGLWSGTQRTLQGTVTLRPSYRFNMSVGLQRTDAELDLPDASFTSTLVTGRANYSFTTNMFLDALSQYDPERHLLNANVRFNLIHHPLSDLFLVYNEQRFTSPVSLEPGGPLQTVAPGRSLVLKFTHMLAF